MSWQDDIRHIEQLYHQKLRTEATFEWMYVRSIDDAKLSSMDCNEMIDGYIQLGKHVVLHGQHQIAKKLFEKTLELVELKAGYESLRAGQVIDNIAYCLMAQGRYNEALATMEKWMATASDAINKDGYDYRELMAHYAEVLYRANRNEQAKDVVRDVLQLTPQKDPLHTALLEKLQRYDTPCPTSFDPADADQAQLLNEEMLHGSPNSLESLRQAVFEIIVKQALAGAPWKEICRGPMEINGITVMEVEDEVERRKALTH